MAGIIDLYKNDYKYVSNADEFISAINDFYIITFVKLIDDNEKKILFSKVNNSTMHNKELILGYCYQNGCGVNEDKTKAFYYFQIAAEKGDFRAKHAVALAYLNGWGVKKDLDRAIKDIREYADNGYTPSQVTLGYCYYMGLGIKKNYDLAFFYYNMAASKGNVVAINNIGRYYALGEACAIDIKKRDEYTLKAARIGLPLAMRNAALDILLSSAEDPSKISEGLIWLRKAASKGEKIAQFRLGEIYYNGFYLNKSYSEALYWLTKTLPDEKRAYFYLGNIFEKGYVLKKDIVKAIEYYEKGSDYNCDKCQYALGCLYFKGEFVTKNIDLAVHYLSLSSSLGNYSAKELLEQIKSN